MPSKIEESSLKINYLVNDLVNITNEGRLQWAWHAGGFEAKQAGTALRISREVLEGQVWFRFQVGSLSISCWDAVQKTVHAALQNLYLAASRSAAITGQLSVLDDLVRSLQQPAETTPA